jgi:hypothetical protein
LSKGAIRLEEPGKKKIKNVIIAVAVTSFFIGLLILYIPYSIKYDAAVKESQAAIASQKAPANVVIEEASTTDEGEDSDKKWKSISILFRETAGACGTHAELHINYIDTEGSVWAEINGESYDLAFDIAPGGTYTYSNTFTNVIRDTILEHVEADHINLIFGFEDEGGRKQRIEYTVFFN